MDKTIAIFLNIFLNVLASANHKAYLSHCEDAQLEHCGA